MTLGGTQAGVPPLKARQYLANRWRLVYCERDK